MACILLFGTSGCAKENFLHALENRGHQYFSIGTTPIRWQKPHNVLQLRAKLEEQINNIRTRVQSKRQTCLVSLHATHLTEAFIYSAIPVEALRDIHPTLCVTIIDDLYAMQARLRSNGYQYSYRDLMLWLRAEILVADLIANEIVKNTAVRTKNFVLSVKHPKSTALRLFQNASACKVYAAYSITGVIRERQIAAKKRLLKQNIRYRRKLYDLGAIVFDPGTLDDRILINKIPAHERPRTGYVTINKQERWPYVIDSKLNSPAVQDPPAAFPIRIPHVEAFALKTTPQSPHRPYSDIDAFITQIDLRYVSQADFVTVWRPFCRGTHSVGCLREAQTAVELGKNAVAYSPREDREMLTGESRPLYKMWPSEVPLLEQEDEFWDRVQECFDNKAAPAEMRE